MPSEIRVDQESFAGPSGKNKPFIFYFDFDNTITSYDVLDDVIARFSTGKEWVALEKAWQAGEIGSKSCLVGQLACIRVATKKLQKYLWGIKVDPYFKKLLTFLRRKHIETVIVSDSFTFLIREILKSNGIYKILVCANELELKQDQLVPSFPHGNMDCPDCAHCKKRHILASKYHDRRVVYVGDGRSDFCAAMESDLVFAKGTLLEYLQKEGKPCLPFEDFESIYTTAKQLLAGNPKTIRHFKIS